MDRRVFLKAGFFSAVALGCGIGMGFPPGVAASGAALQRTLVNIMLNGGADFRYVLAPLPTHDPVYVAQYWAARSGLYSQNYPDYATMYANEYQTVIDPVSEFSFGVHNSCGWLAQQFNAGNVAIVSNAFGSLNRRHDHSQTIINTGDLQASQLVLDRDGWGGRLVEVAGGNSNVLSINSSVSIFTHGSDPSNRLARVIHGGDMRNMTLLTANPALGVAHGRNIIARALNSYYKERGIEVEVEKPDKWPYHRFFKHNDSLRLFGDQIADRLANSPMPATLSALNLKNNKFEQECRNLYDACLTSDILGLKVISMDFDGWDTHGNQQATLNFNLHDVFGAEGGLNTVYDQLSIDKPDANNNLVYCFASDFGRQLAVNGSRGTDHGRGNYIIMVGHAVNGGVYGEMFPQREALPDPQDSLDRSPFEIPDRDIDGLTSFERVFAQACDWTVPGAGPIVFPDAPVSPLEAGVNLTGLFSA